MKKTPNSPPEKAAKMGTVAVVIANDASVESVESVESIPQGTPVKWLETFSDEREIIALEKAIEAGNPFPLQSVYEFRAASEREDQEFGDYVEDLLCQKSVRPEVQSHGVAWLRSKMKIEHFRRQEKEAAEVIANFALTRYREDPKLVDFILAGPGIQVRIRIFKIRVAAGTSAAAA